MGEPILDLSEIMGLYKEDALRTVARMQDAFSRWSEVQQGGPARADLRRMSHQLRGSGRTYGFRHVTRICKAIENITIKMEKNALIADSRVQASIQTKLALLGTAFREED
jgi:chemotaxis protein histidine kinase CheA